MKPLKVEQILQLGLHEEEKRAPEAPSWEQLQRRMPAAATMAARPWRKDWWKVAFERLSPSAPQRYRLAHGAAALGKVVEESVPLGTIPAVIVSSGADLDVQVEVTKEPELCNGYLTLNVRLPEEAVPEAVKEMKLLLLHDRDMEPLSAGVLTVGKETRISIALPPEVIRRWKDRSGWDWHKIPFRFALIPPPEPPPPIKPEPPPPIKVGWRDRFWRVYQEYIFLLIGLLICLPIVLLIGLICLPIVLLIGLIHLLVTLLVINDRYASLADSKVMPIVETAR